MSGSPEKTLRDEFAMAAIAGMIASCPVTDRTEINKRIWANVAYDFADALLAARGDKL